MSAANRATSARARASIAARILKRNKTYAEGGRGDLGRAFSDCFENGDGEEVIAILCARVRTDPELRAAVLRHAGDGQGVYPVIQTAGELDLPRA